MNGPLSNLKVIDFSSVLMGPYCTMMLSDMGADVIKVERPSGDSTRYIGPSHTEGMGSMFLNLNRNKRSISLDLKKEKSKNAIFKLLQESDVFVHSLRPHTMKKLGLAYEDVVKVNPKIIYCGMYGFSKEGPYNTRPAYDDIIQAASGMAAVQGDMAGEPQYLSALIADKTTGLIGASTIMAALLHREKTGEGQEIEVPMFESMVSFSMVEHMYGHTFSPPIGDSVYPRAASPNRKPYKTADGYISVLIYSDKQWLSFFEVSGNEHLRNDHRFKDISARTNNINYVYETVQKIIESKTTNEWLELLEKGDIPCVNVNRPEDLFHDPHLEKLNFFETVKHPSEGKIKNMKFPATFSSSKTEVRRLAPHLGEHSEEILREAGYDEQEIKKILNTEEV
ncbi:CoA transferase [Lentibacillus kapialis]|uniref:CoA transferase n=1 Tax=Lentibacillus kapialis TaxID=340214 RepID=A0A917PXJ5_9BACI|nr:CoA transferase [Lentibacillus kapialis]GGJ99221.1 CoA transferase [Lentibacillus kapialis]